MGVSFSLVGARAESVSEVAELECGLADETAEIRVG
jgi:hypothetical protein